MRSWLFLCICLALLILLLSSHPLPVVAEQQDADSNDEENSSAQVVQQEVDVLDDASSSSNPIGSVNVPPRAPADATASIKPKSKGKKGKRSRKKLSDANAEELLRAQQEQQENGTATPTTAHTSAADGDEASDKPKPPLRWGLLDPSAPLYGELVAVLLVVAYLINFYLGVNNNREIVSDWFSSFAPILHEQFSLVGAYTADAKAIGALYTLPTIPAVKYFKDSHSTYHLHCTGRRYCSSLLLTLELINRADLFSLLSSFFTPTRDQITFDLNLTDLPPFILALVRKKYEKRMKKNVKDLTLYTNIIKPTPKLTSTCGPTLTNTLSIMTDNAELTESLLCDGSEGYGKLLQSVEELFLLLHISDQAIPVDWLINPANITTPAADNSNDSSSSNNTQVVASNTNTQILHWKMYLPRHRREKDRELLCKVLKGVLSMVDKVSNLNMPTAAMTRAIEIRERVAEQERIEAEQKAKKKDSKGTSSSSSSSAAEKAEEKKEKKEKKDKKDRIPKPKFKVLR